MATTTSTLLPIDNSDKALYRENKDQEDNTIREYIDGNLGGAIRSYIRAI